MTVELDLDADLLEALQGVAERKGTTLGEAVSRHIDLHRYTFLEVLQARAEAFGLTEDEAMGMAADELAELRAQRAADAERGSGSR